MGQQQLLLIVLGVIIVGIAVVVGINVFTASATEANRNAIIGDCTNLSSMAQQHYRKPTEMGGGGNTFTGWTIPTQLASTANGSYVETVGAQSVTIVATGTEIGNDGSDSVQVTMIVSPTNITSTTINN
ncbi:MAG: hypothetical protein KAQ90_06095 [Melioribacteraceae bacterium]|nr:hypothetical protein [Melioribacteraceae bacterium]